MPNPVPVPVRPWLVPRLESVAVVQVERVTQIRILDVFHHLQLKWRLISSINHEEKETEKSSISVQVLLLKGLFFDVRRHNQNKFRRL